MVRSSDKRSWNPLDKTSEVRSICPFISLAYSLSQIRDFQLGLSQHLGLAIVCLVQVLVGLALALRINWKLALVILSAIPVMAIGAGLISRKFQAHVDGQYEALTKATKIASNCITNIVTVKCCNTQEREADSYKMSIRAAAIFAIKQALISAMQLGFVRFATIAMLVQGKLTYTCCIDNTYISVQDSGMEVHKSTQGLQREAT